MPLGTVLGMSLGLILQAAPKLSVAPTPRVSVLRLSAATQLEQLAGMTTLSIDTGDLNVIEKMAATGCITDATTNPLFVSQVSFIQ